MFDSNQDKGPETYMLALSLLVIEVAMIINIYNIFRYLIMSQSKKKYVLTYLIE